MLSPARRETMGWRPSPIYSDPIHSTSPGEYTYRTRTRMNISINRAVIVATVALALAIGTNSVYAGKFNIQVIPENAEVGRSQVGVCQITMANDGNDGYDASFLASPNSSAVDAWAKVSFNPYFLYRQANNANSTSNFLVEVSGRGLGGPENVNLQFQMNPIYQQNNFTWKNLVVELYNNGDIKDPANRLGVYDAKDLVSKKIIFPTLSVTEGLSYQIVVRPRNYADYNLDNSVDIADLAILSEHWLSADPNETNTWEEYTDIDRDGAVGISDLAIFVSQWLFKGVDPDTFSCLDPIRNDESENVLRTRNQWAVDNRLRIPV
jgi:hypothetical protein